MAAFVKLVLRVLSVRQKQVDCAGRAQVQL